MARMVALLLLVAFVTGCAQTPVTLQPGQKAVVVASVSILADLVHQVASDRVDLSAMLGPGQDPHTYEPTPKDSVTIANSHVVFMNGMDLEVWGKKLIQNAGGKRTVVELADRSLDPLPWKDAREKKYDPHMWMDPIRVKKYVEKIRDTLSQVDPAGKETYAQRTAAYQKELDALDAWIRSEISKIPPDKRKLVTTHDAYQYFGHRYGLKVLDTVWGVSTEDEPTAKDIARLVDILKQHKVSPFIETTINPQLMQQIAKQAGVSIGGTLYGDQLGPPGSGADTYISMMQYNTTTIVRALSGE